MYKNNEIQDRPGKTKEEVLEDELNKILSEARNIVGKNCEKFLPKCNPPFYMCICGAKVVLKF